MNIIKSAIERQIVEIDLMLRALKETTVSEWMKSIIVQKLEINKRNLIELLGYIG